MFWLSVGEPMWEPSCTNPVWLGLRAVATAKTASTSPIVTIAGTVPFTRPVPDVGVGWSRLGCRGELMWSARFGRWSPEPPRPHGCSRLQPDEIGHHLHLQAEKFSPGLDHIVELAGEFEADHAE